MAAFSSEEAKGRPAGAPEFLAYSHKSGGQVRLYCRPSFWHWAVAEFNPYITNMLVNQITLNLDRKRVSVALQYEMHGTLNFVFSKREVSDDSKSEIMEYFEKNGIQSEFLGAKCLREEQVHVDNLLCMLSYIAKYKEIYTEKSLELALYMIERCEGTINGAVRELQDKYSERAAALLFELVRRGRVNISDLRHKRISGLTQIDVVRVWHG
jgi:hypothetical protein